MPSMKCHECGEVKKCTLYVDPSIVSTERPKGLIVYLCKRCMKDITTRGESNA